MISYSQNLEDVLLNRAFQGRREGFYIDVGAWHPTKDSVTKHFYDLGWRGINVEPLEDAMAIFRTERPRDLNLALALGDVPSRRAFLRVAGTGLSTLDLGRREEYEALGLSCSEVVVEVSTLGAVCQEHVRCEIDFLTIDVEGAEAAVLAGGDWDNYRPRVLLVEGVSPDPAIFLRPSPNVLHRARPAWEVWERNLLDRGYRFCLFDGVNRIYIRDEEPELADLLSVPANVLDNFVSCRVVEAERELEAARHELQGTQTAFAKERQAFDERIAEVAAAAEEARRAEVAQMAASMASLDEERRAEVAQMAASMALLEEERRAVATQVAALRGALNQADERRLHVEDKLEHVERERHAFRHEAEELQRQMAQLLTSKSWRLTQPFRELRMRLSNWSANR